VKKWLQDGQTSRHSRVFVIFFTLEEKRPVFQLGQVIKVLLVWVFAWR
jgi:hypothetical protein